MSHEEITIVVSPPEVHRYFVAFWWHGSGSMQLGHGFRVLDLKSPIRSAEHITDLGLALHEDKTIPDGVAISITNIIRLDTL